MVEVTTPATARSISEPESLQPAVPVATPDISDTPLQVLFGHDAVRQSPLHWEPTNTAKFMNTNTGIIGTMGTGKTQFTKSLVTQLMRNQSCNVEGKPIGLLIFDYKSDYVDEAFIDATGAKSTSYLSCLTTPYLFLATRQCYQSTPLVDYRKRWRKPMGWAINSSSN